uniref:Immunoglobulin-binding protein 1 n=1 Tax=Romanomermis culicivorax TaxID=13658 RepID=A0A915KHZ4_ROMCU
MENSDHVNSILNHDLARVVEDATELDDQISGTNSKEYQDRVKSTIGKLENMTRQVSRLDMFSENENLDELSTYNLRFLMLPALLACLNDKIIEVDRRQNLACVEVYICDFIKRLKSYGILPSSSYQFNVDSKESDSHGEKPALSSVPSQSSSTAEYLASAIRNREDKMKLYREHREFKDKYTTACKKYENLLNQQDEEFLPPKPVILTRCKLQKEVFGLGYPSIPTMTVEEFFEAKTKDGQIQAVNSYQGGPMTEEDEEIAKERAREKDDEELIQSERGFDEYKDDHRRGWGNTYNKG